MGLLYLIKCGYCRNLFAAISCGVCEVTDHAVIHTEDDDFAENCPYYENKYGYDNSGTNPVKVKEFVRHDSKRSKEENQ